MQPRSFLKDLCNQNREPANTLELQPHRELNHAGAATHDAGCGADGCGHRASHGRRNLTEVRVALIGDRIGKVRMVENIEKVRPELKPQPFRSEGEVLGSRKIEIHQVRAIVLVASGSTDASSRGSLREVGGVEGSVGICVVLLQLSGTSYIGTVVELIESAEIRRAVYTVTCARSAVFGTRVELTVGFTCRKPSQDAKKNV